MIEENLLTQSKQRNMTIKARKREVTEKRKRFYESMSAKIVLIDRSVTDPDLAGRSSANSSGKLCISFFSLSSVKKTKPFIGFFAPFDTEVYRHS